jgi:hypothetical protein
MKTNSQLFVHRFIRSNIKSKNHTGNKFVHQPLNLYKREFRLLRVLPREDESELILLELRNFVYGEQSYRTLSYMWGSSLNSRTILINGLEFGIRASLWTFFNETSHASHNFLKENLWYWIDAVCIDQQNLPERNHQVSLMALIYSEASDVLIWLGGAADDSDYAMLILDLNDTQSSCTCLRSELDAREDELKFKDCGLCCLINDRFYNAYSALCKREYWQR